MFSAKARVDRHHPFSALLPGAGVQAGPSSARAPETAAAGTTACREFSGFSPMERWPCIHREEKSSSVSPRAQVKRQKRREKRTRTAAAAARAHAVAFE
jgi:hypothetical protein